MPLDPEFRYRLADHVQARLNPQDDDDRAALEVFYRWLDEGYAPRQIVTHALLALGNRPFPEGGISTRALRKAFEEMQDVFADLLGNLLDERLEELARLSPRERKQQVKDAAQSSFHKSILNAVDVADYEDDN